MKMFVWANPYSVPYGTSMLIAFGKNEAAARKEAARGAKYAYAEFGGERSDWSSIVEKLGPPTRIVDLPCAEWHEWSE